MKTTVAVFFGGRSVEHEISVISASQAMHAMNRDKYNVIPIYITKQGRWVTGDALFDVKNYRDMKALVEKCEEVYMRPEFGDFNLYRAKTKLFGGHNVYAAIDVVIPVLHGTNGEDGIFGNGAGLVMSTLDVVAYAGENHGNVKPANFLDIGGGASAEVMAAGLEIILGDEQVKSVFVNVFGGITACDAVADGIVKALEILGDAATKPLVVRLDGNNVAEGRRILSEANHPLVVLAETMDSGADKAAELAHKA